MKELHAKFNEAVRLYQNGHIQKVEALCLKILEENPNYVHALHLLGSIAHMRGQAQRAVELINQAIAIVPDNPLYHFNLGNAHKALNRLDEALKAYENTLALKPDYAEAWNELGMTHFKSGNPELALEYRKKVLEISPSSAAT